MSRLLFAMVLSMVVSQIVDGGWAYVRPPPRRIIATPHSKSKSHPQQVHVSLAGKDHMRITWVTDDKHVPSVVDYGRRPGEYEASATGERTSYQYFLYLSGEIHHVKIGPLDPNTVYYYRCGGIEGDYTFKTPPASLPVEFVIVGDLGQTEWTASTLHHANKSDYDLLILPGDLSYADGQQSLWDTFGRLASPFASRRPWMVTQGNHEVESLPLGRPFVSYNARWLMPHAESASASNLYYSFDVADGAIHVVMLGSYADFGPGSDQRRWLESDLARVDRRHVGWVVAVVHAPWYSTNVAHEGEGEGMREALESLLYDARVDVVFAGHVHAYERFGRVYNNSSDGCGPVHITIGDGGNREGLALMFKETSSPMSVLREASFGHGRLRVYNATHARWSWHRNDDSDSTVRDEVWLTSLGGSSECVGPRPCPANDEL